MMKKLTLFGTLGCHLCEEAEHIIASCDLNQYNIESIDIAEQEQWQEKYAIRIPVLYHPQSKQELNWPFTALDVNTFFNQLSDD